MMDSAVFAAVLGALAGFALGIGYFGALAWTTQRLVRTSRPAGLMLASLVARMGLLALGLVTLARLSPWALGAAVPGVIAARLLLVRRFGALPAAATTAGARDATGGTAVSKREVSKREVSGREVSGRGEPDRG